MRKILAVFLVLCMIISLVACGKTDVENPPEIDAGGIGDVSGGTEDTSGGEQGNVSDGFRSWYIYCIMFCSVSITNSSKHICNWIAHCHVCFLLIYYTRLKRARSYQLAFLTPGISPLYANSRKQILQIPYFLK